MRAVAAEALLPLAQVLAADPPQALHDTLWDILLEVEELSPSTGQLPWPSLITVAFLVDMISMAWVEDLASAKLCIWSTYLACQGMHCSQLLEHESITPACNPAPYHFDCPVVFTAMPQLL